MNHDAARVATAHTIVSLIGMPDTQEPYVNPEYPGVPTGAFVESWICGCHATPAGGGSSSLHWEQCAAHRDVDRDSSRNDV